MGWPELFLICLVVGLAFSFLSALSGAFHIPHLHLHVHAHAGVGGHGAGHGIGGWLNPGSVAAFLMWFGGAGYLLERFADWRLAMVLAIASLCGLAGAALVGWFMARFLMGHEKPLDPADYDMTGVLGRLASPIRTRGTGEMIFSLQGTRSGVPARSESGEALEQGLEVIVTRYEGGIAYVRSWDELQKKF